MNKIFLSLLGFILIHVSQAQTASFSAPVQVSPPRGTWSVGSPRHIEVRTTSTCPPGAMCLINGTNIHLSIQLSGCGDAVGPIQYFVVDAAAPSVGPASHPQVYVSVLSYVRSSPFAFCLSPPVAVNISVPLKSFSAADVHIIGATPAVGATATPTSAPEAMLDASVPSSDLQ